MATNDKQIVRKLEKEFDYVDSKLIEMRTSAEGMAGEARERFSREVDGLKARVDRMRTEFDEAKGWDQGMWETVKGKIQGGLDEVKKSFKSMQDRFK